MCSHLRSRRSPLKQLSTGRAKQFPKNRIPEACGDPLCTVAHGIFAHWWSTHGALQLPVAWQTRSAPYERNGDVRKPWCPKCQNFPSNVDAFLGFQGLGKYSQSVGALRRILGVRFSQPAPASAVKWGVGFHPGLRNITGANFSCASWVKIEFNSKIMVFTFELTNKNLM